MRRSATGSTPRQRLALLLPLALAMPSALAAQGLERAPEVAPLEQRPVAARRLSRGTVLTARDIALAPPAANRPLRPSRPEGATVAPGWVARRVIQPGEALRAPAVTPPPLVRAGQAVQFTLHHAGISLSLAGVAPVAGALGDTIPVRLGARRRMTGVVAGPALVVALSSPRTP